MSKIGFLQKTLNKFFRFWYDFVYFLKRQSEIILSDNILPCISMPGFKKGKLCIILMWVLSKVDFVNIIFGHSFFFISISYLVFQNFGTSEHYPGGIVSRINASAANWNEFSNKYINMFNAKYKWNGVPQNIDRNIYHLRLIRCSSSLSLKSCKWKSDQRQNFSRIIQNYSILEWNRKQDWCCLKIENQNLIDCHCIILLFYLPFRCYLHSEVDWLPQ